MGVILSVSLRIEIHLTDDHPRLLLEASGTGYECQAGGYLVVERIRLHVVSRGRNKMKSYMVLLFWDEVYTGGKTASV